MSPATCVVALPIPADKPYTYAVPMSLLDRVQPGSRVLVPVRTRQLIGVVLEVGDDSHGDLKEVLLAPDDEPVLPQALIELGRWVASYYTTPIGLTFRAMLPPALWGSSRLVAQVREPSAAPRGASRDVIRALQRVGGRAPAASLARSLRRPVWDTLQRLQRVGSVTLETEPPTLGPAPRRERVLVVTRALPSLLEREREFGRATRQRGAYEAIEALGGEAPVEHLVDRLGFSRAVLKALTERGVARIEERKRLRDPFNDVRGLPPPEPTLAQRGAMDGIRKLPEGGTALLWGVTGSGKTLVYLEAFRHEVERGRGVIVLVPEISLTPQTIARVIGVYGDTVAVLHSGLSDAERADAWLAVVTGQRRVVVGARSGVFAPVRDLAAIVVDEEHDSSYKHGESPRYHARDVAIRRGVVEGARVVLGSATPSLETWAARERVVALSLPNRVKSRPLPDVMLIDMRTEPTVAESGSVPWSKVLDESVGAVLERGQQAILLLNRRGFAHFLQCMHCGTVVGCPHCSISLTVHRVPRRLRCHYCGHDEPIPEKCGACGREARQERGTGTQLLEQWIAERYSGARVARMDADTTTARWSHRRILDAVERRQVDILLGTQMVAKGLDFPGVTLVGVVDADTALHLPDFRAAERTFQLIAQVAGRAGRGPDGGRVLVQTRTPHHYALQAAEKHDVEGFAEREMEVRRSPPYPPHVGLVRVIVSGPKEVMVANAACDIADWLRGLVKVRALDSIDVVGPAPAPLARVKRRWRWHVLLRAREKRVLDRVARYAARRSPHAAGRHVRVVFDRDPVSLL